MNINYTNINYTDAIVQSPTATQAYLVCPQRYAYYRGHDRPLLSEEMVKGRQLHHALAVIAQKTSHTLQDEKDAEVLPQRDLASISRAYEVNAYVARILPGYIMESELRLGKAVLDSVWRSGSETYVVVDYKYITSIPDIFTSVDDTLQRNHQLLHYAWALSQYRGLWYGKDNWEIGVGLCFVSDSDIKLITTAYNRRILQKWLDNVMHIWYNMQRIQDKQGVYYKNMGGCIEEYYGQHVQCMYYEKCHAANTVC